MSTIDLILHAHVEQFSPVPSHSWSVWGDHSPFLNSRG